MDYSAAFQISATGMAVEKLRLDVTAANIANMHTAAATPGQVYQPAATGRPWRARAATKASKAWLLVLRGT